MDTNSKWRGLDPHGFDRAHGARPLRLEEGLCFWDRSISRKLQSATFRSTKASAVGYVGWWSVRTNGLGPLHSRARRRQIVRERRVNQPTLLHSTRVINHTIQPFLTTHTYNRHPSWDVAGGTGQPALRPPGALAYLMAELWWRVSARWHLPLQFKDFLILMFFC